MNEQERPRDTETQEDLDTHTVSQLQQVLTQKATILYADKTKPPSLTLPDAPSAKHRHSRSWASRPRPKTRSPHLWVAAAASVACLAAASALILNGMGEPDDKISVVTQPTHTQTPALSASNDGESTGNSTSQGPSTGLPAHMEKTHDGPARFAKYPFYCPADAKGKPGSASTPIFTDTPVNPIEYCQQRDRLGKVNPERAYVSGRAGTIWVLERHPDRNPATLDPAQRERDRAREATLPDGVTYTGRDYEVLFMLQAAHPRTGDTCPTFRDFTQSYRSALESGSVTSWRVANKDPNPTPSKASWCHGSRIDLGTRTIYLSENPKAVGNQEAVDAKQKERNQRVREIMETVNSECLSAKHALSRANAMYAAVPNANPKKPASQRIVVVERTCAALYLYPAGSVQFIAFGS